MKTAVCSSIEEELLTAINSICRDEEISRSWLVSKVLKGWLAATQDDSSALSHDVARAPARCHYSPRTGSVEASL